MKKNHTLLLLIGLAASTPVVLAYALLNPPAQSSGPAFAPLETTSTGQISDVNRPQAPSEGLTAGEQSFNSSDGNAISIIHPVALTTEQSQYNTGAAENPQADGVTCAAGQSASLDASASSSASANQPDPLSLPREVSLPLAFRPLPPGFAAAHPQMADAIHNLQQQFIAAVGGPNQNPNDPTYYRKWIGAQPGIDEQYHLLVGDGAFLLDQIHINTNAQTSSAR